MNREAAIKQIDEALSLAAGVQEDKRVGQDRGAHITEFLVSTIDRFTRPGSTYRQKLSHLREEEKRSYAGYTIPTLVGVLRSVRQEVQAGYMERIFGLIQAETFTDFLEMADHLLEQGYKDPAAVLAGSVLEQHLRALCKANDIEVMLPEGRWKKADALNADLARNEIYTKVNQKNVTYWLGLRNEAAHGNYNNYAAENVRIMLEGISIFMSQYPS